MKIKDQRPTTLSAICNIVYEGPTKPVLYVLRITLDKIKNGNIKSMYGTLELH